MLISSSLGGPLDPWTVKPIIENKKRVFYPKHTKSHIDCLVGGKEVPNFQDRAQEYIDSIIPLAGVSFTGLNTVKLLGKRWQYSPLQLVSTGEPSPLPGGKHKGETVPQIINKSKEKYLAIIYGSNNRYFYDGTVSVENAMNMFFTELNILLENSTFEAVFIATIFPRSADIDQNNNVISNVKKFNEMFLSHRTRTIEKYFIYGKNDKGERRAIRWIPVDMTDTLIYSEMKELKYYCCKNYKKPSNRHDLTHINAVYLEIYLKKLSNAVLKYNKSVAKFQKTRKRKFDEMMK